MSHGSPIPLGAFETPDVRLARLRTQMDSTSQSMGDTVTGLVDLEARRRAMEDNLRRFREVEQRQNLQFPSSVPQAGTFTTGEVTTPEQRLALSAPPSPVEVEQRLREGGPGLGELLSGVPTSPEELARVLGRRVAETGVPTRGIEEFETRVARPFGASALQIVESPAGGGILGATELKGLQRRVEELGVPEEVSPLPRERTFAESLEAGGGAVNPFAALIGDKEEQEKAVAVLEEAGLPRALAFEVIFDITNLAPGVGLTRVAPFARALKVAVGATGRTRQAAVAALRNSDVVKDALRAGERGGPLRGGEELGGFAERFAGRARRLEGGPPTTRPVTTYEEARQGLVKFLDEETKLRKTGIAAAEISTGRKGQFAGVRAGTEEALEAGLRGEEAATAGLRGAAAPRGLRQTVGELALPPVQKDALFDEGTRLFTSGEILETEFIQATVALKQAFSGRGLQPGQIDIIRKIHGVEVAEKLARRVRPITEAKQLQKAARELSKTLTRTTNIAVRETKKSIAALTKARQAEVVGDFRAARDLMKESIRAATRSDDVIIQEAELLLRETREALEGVSPRLAKRADDQITKLRLDMENKFARSEDLVAKAQLIAPDTPELQTVITEWLRINEALLEGVSSEMGGFFAATKAVVTGQLPDSFLSYLSQRRAILATILSRMMPNDPQLVGKITNELMEAELRRRYGVDVPQQVRDILAVTKRAPYEEGLGWVETLVQRTKNTMFGLDIGVFMIQGLTAVRSGGIPMISGFVNRMLAAARLPHVAVALADESLPRWSKYLLNGVHQGVGPSAVRAEQGTLFRYLPKLAGGAIDVPLSAATEALNQLQFGVILTQMRNLTFEGNLVMAHLLGRNLQDAKTIATLAESANATTSFAWTALRAGRATAERTLLISPSMTRAMVNRVLLVAKGMGPGATATERMVSASIVSSWAMFTLGVGKLVNDHVGVGEFIFDPTKPGFGLINLRNGRTINLFPQATLVKAIGKSFTAIQEGDPDLAKRAWISMGVGRASIVGSAIGALFDTGFQPGVGFRVGDLPLKGKILNLLPMPPVIEEIISEGPSAFGIISELGGASQFETSPFTELRIAWESARGTRGIPDREFNPETDFAIAEQDSRLRPIVERSRARGVAAGFPSAVAAQQRDELRIQLEGEFQLPTLAQSVPSDPIAGPAFVDAWFEVQDRMSGAVALDFLGEERNRETPLGQAVLAWQQIRLQDEKFFDRETLKPDRQAYREAKDAAFAEIRQLDSALADALEQRTPSADPNVKKVEADMLEALDVRRELFDMPRHVGVSPDEEREASDFRELVDQARDRIAAGGQDPGGATIQQYLAVAQDNGIASKVAYLAFALRPNSEGEASLRDVRYTEFLFDNAELLSVFFPELYGARRLLQGLTPEIQERVIEAAR